MIGRSMMLGIALMALLISMAIGYPSPDLGISTTSEDNKFTDVTMVPGGQISTDSATENPTTAGKTTTIHSTTIRKEIPMKNSTGGNSPKDQSLTANPDSSSTIGSSNLPIVSEELMTTQGTTEKTIGSHLYAKQTNSLYVVEMNDDDDPDNSDSSMTSPGKAEETENFNLWDKLLEKGGSVKKYLESLGSPDSNSTDTSANQDSISTTGNPTSTVVIPDSSSTIGNSNKGGKPEESGLPPKQTKPLHVVENNDNNDPDNSDSSMTNPKIADETKILSISDYLDAGGSTVEGLESHVFLHPSSIHTTANPDSTRTVENSNNGRRRKTSGLSRKQTKPLHEVENNDNDDPNNLNSSMTNLKIADETKILNEWNHVREKSKSANKDPESWVSLNSNSTNTAANQVSISTTGIPTSTTAIPDSSSTIGNSNNGGKRKKSVPSTTNKPSGSTENAITPIVTTTPPIEREPHSGSRSLHDVSDILIITSFALLISIFNYTNYIF